jgi:hypothetical protein
MEFIAGILYKLLSCEKKGARSHAVEGFKYICAVCCFAWGQAVVVRVSYANQDHRV